MLAIERRNHILSTIQKNESVLVNELSKVYNVTEETIRRDLEKLEKSGYVKKTYGGAVYIQNHNFDIPLKIREKTNIAEKEYIADKVASMVEDGDSLMLDSSSTVLSIAKRLKEKKKLTVITNSIEVLLTLADLNNVTLISTGGVVRESSLSLVGPTAQRTISSFNVDKAILSCKGIGKNITESTEYEAAVKRAMIESAKQVIVAVDSSKFGQSSLAKLMDVKEADYIVTEKMPDSKWISLFDGIESKILY